MKRLSLYLIFSFIFLNAFAQNAATSFEVDGMKVILKPTAKEIIHITMYYRGGLANYPAEKAGLENLALAGATECGTKTFNKDAFKDRADAFGIAIGGSSSYDYGNISVNCISKYFHEGWGLFSEAIKAPTFEEREFGMLKEKVLSSVKESEADPDSHLDKLSIKNAFAGTPYVNDPVGDEKSLVNITAAEVKKYYYDQLLNKKRMFLVVVGKVSKEEITRKIKESFAGLLSKNYTSTTYKAPQFVTGTVVSENRKLATNYITGAVSAPKMTDKDYVAYKLAISILSDRLFKEIRTKRNLSYAPYAYSTNRMLPFGIMYVSTTDPKASVQVMVDEVKRLKREGFYESELRDAKSGFITNNYMKEESTSAIASALGNAEVIGDWRIAEQMPDMINKVTLREMNETLKYFDKIRWTYLGDKKLLDEAGAAFRTSFVN